MGLTPKAHLLFTFIYLFVSSEIYDKREDFESAFFGWLWSPFYLFTELDIFDMLECLLM